MARRPSEPAPPKHQLKRTAMLRHAVRLLLLSLASFAR